MGLVDWILAIWIGGFVLALLVASSSFRAIVAGFALAMVTALVADGTPWVLGAFVVGFFASHAVDKLACFDGTA